MSQQCEHSLTLHSLSILPRSRHLPVAVTEGSLTRNLNKTGVRLWTWEAATLCTELTGATLRTQSLLGVHQSLLTRTPSTLGNVDFASSLSCPAEGAEANPI
jgi:hypothetical protein